MLLGTLRNVALLMFETLKYLGKRPKMLLMVVVAFILYAPMYYYLVLMESTTALDWTPFLIRSAVFFVGVPLIYTAVNFVLIEMAIQEHQEKRIRLFHALIHGMKTFLKALPLVILWTVFRYVLSIFKPIFSPPRFGDNKISSINREMNTSRAGIRYMDIYAVAKWETGKNVMTTLYRRGLHDGFMMMYTGLSVEEGYFKGLKKALQYYQEEAGLLRTGYDAASFYQLILVLPAMLSIGLLLHDVTLMVLFGYLGVVWIYTVIVKQLLITNLYLWMNDLETSNETNIYQVNQPVYLYGASSIYLHELNKA